MKQRKFLLLMALPIILIILAGCESGGKFQVINRTSYPVYVSLDGGSEAVIPAAQERVFEVDTDSESFLTGKVEQKVKAKIIGETYHILDDVNDIWVDETEVKIRAGKTLSAYIDPNRASIKIKNNSSQQILTADIFKHNYVTSYKIATLSNIESGESRFLRVDYVTLNNSGQYVNPFYYVVQIRMLDETTAQYNNMTEPPLVDTQFLVEIEDPE